MLISSSRYISYMTKTPSQLWNDTIAEYKKQCGRIIDVSKSVRYVGIINSYGRTLAGVIQSGRTPMLRREQVTNEFFVISTLLSLRKNSVDQIGNLEHGILYHKKVIIVVIPKDENVFYVSLSRRAKDPDRIISQIKKIIQSR